MSTEPKRSIPPYTTHLSFINLINDLRDGGIPAEISRSVIKGSNSGKATMSASLKSMGLIDDKSKPTELLTTLVKEKDSYKANLNLLMKATYSFLLDGNLDLANATTEMVAQKFKDAGASGSTISKGMGLFLALAKDAGIEVSSRVKAPAPDRNGSRAKVKKNAASDSSVDDGEDDGDKQGRQTPSDKTPEGMIRIPIPLHGMEDGAILLPNGLNKMQWAYAKKMAAFILDNYHTDFQEEAPK